MSISTDRTGTDPHRRARPDRDLLDSWVAPPNTFKEKLLAGEELIGLWLATGEPYLAGIAGGSGFDWLCIDGEHGPNDLRSILAQLTALQGSPSAPVVRAPAGETWMIKQLLDVGAQTLLIPMVESAEQARQLVRAVRYPPHGVRGMGAAIARASNFGRVTDYTDSADSEVCLLVQAESRRALQDLAGIAAVPGVDGVFIGPVDLAADLGVPQGGEEVNTAIDQAIDVIRTTGTAAGVLTSDPDRRFLDRGATFVAVGTDITRLTTSLDTLASSYGRGRAPHARAGY